MSLLDVFFRKKPPRVVPPAPRINAGTIPPANIQVVAPESASEPGVPRYPPMDAGIRVATPDDMLASQADIIRVLKRNLGVPDDDFELRYLAPLRRAANLVNLIPATRDKHHTGAGGLFRYAATMGVRAAQSADGRIFAASEGIERRRQTEAAWRHAAFLTGLTCELFRPLTEMIVVDPKGNQWSPFVAPLTDWVKQQGVDRFYVRWHQREDARSAANALSSWAVNAVVGNDVLSHLHKIHPPVVETIFGVASGAITTADNSTMATLINEVRRRVIEKDHDTAPTNYGKLTSGSHLEPYFVDAMRKLLRTGVWQVNTKSARCHYGADGFYVAWRQGSQELLGHLQSASIAGVPTERDTLAEMMGRAGIISVAPDGSWVHMVRSSMGNSAAMPAIRIQSPSALLGQLEVKPVADTLRVNPGATAAAKGQQTPKAASVPTAVTPSERVPTTPNQSVPTVEPTLPIAEPTVAKSELAPTLPPATPAAAAPTGAKPASGREQSTASRPPTPKGGIPTVPDADDLADSSFDKDLLLELGSPVCREVAEWRDLWNRGQSAQEFLKTTEGLAISYALITGSALQPQKITEALKGGGHLEISVVGGKQRVFNSIPFAKKTELGLVLRTGFCRKAGFILD